MAPVSKSPSPKPDLQLFGMGIIFLVGLAIVYYVMMKLKNP